MSIGGWNEDELERFVRDRLAPLLAMAGNMGSMPVGGIMPWLVSTPPAGFLLVAGQAVTSDHAALRDLLVADGSPHGTSGGDPLLPDLRGRVPVGLDNMGGSDAGRLTVANSLGGVGGEEKHTLLTSEMPAHTHGPGAGVQYVMSGSGGSDFVAGTSWTLASTTGSAGGGGEHNNMPPYVLMNWIVKA